jgi:hypothetical protein
VFGHVATATGWTFDEIERLTLWELNDLMAYWKDCPPTHVLVAAYLMGGKKSSIGKARRQGQNNFDELTQAVSFAGGSVTKKLPQFYKT